MDTDKEMGKKAEFVVVVDAMSEDSGRSQVEFLTRLQNFLDM